MCVCVCVCVCCPLQARYEKRGGGGGGGGAQGARVPPSVSRMNTRMGVVAKKFARAKASQHPPPAHSGYAPGGGCL